MSSNFLFGISLTASFLAGALALFAPCCITFLFPAYLGTIFKESKKVMYYTFVFALGLSVILIPVALGFKIFVLIFDQFHKEVYYLGGLFLVLMGLATITNYQLPITKLFHVQPKLNEKINTASVFSLGLMSGISSSCCAPVLFAAVTLTSLSPTLLQAIFVSLAYVLGIVFPLFVLSLFYDKITEKISGKKRQNIYQVFKILGGGIFILSGLVIITLNFMGRLQMYQMEGFSQPVKLIIFNISKYFRNPLIDTATFLIIVYVFYKLLKKK